MRISIVTISFNQSQFLEEAIESVLSQNHSDVEYIVVDPGSTDGSMDIIKRFENKIARIIRNPDEGPADGLNKGFQYATGDILGYLNADDIYLPGVLAEVDKIFSTHPAIDVLCGGGYIIDGEGRIKRRIYSDPFNIRRYLYGGVTILQQSTFFRREAFQRSGGFNRDNRTCWDGELMLAFARRKMKIDTIHRLWSGFRIHGSSISGMGFNAEQYHKDLDRFFIEEYGRRMNALDHGLVLWYRLEKWMRNPLALFHRMFRLDRKKGKVQPI